MATNQTNVGGDDNAAEIIRQKVARVYGDEPAAQQELNEADHSPHRSKHQQFIYQLGHSGKGLAAIQTEWHNYYQNLPAHEKHQVWQEFYSSQPAAGGQPAPLPTAHTFAEHKHQAAANTRAKRKKIRDVRSTQDVQAAIRDKVTAGGKLETKHHLQSLFFGLGMGLIVLVIFMFGFFNEVIIAPFIQPSRANAFTPVIVGSADLAPTSTPEVIIPKINVEIPTDFSQTTTNESAIENALEGGVVHYPTTSLPGQTGNTAFFGHSSNNIFNKGKYKFAFVLLHTLQKDDTFYLTYNGKVYTYQVISTNIVEPNQVSVLDPVPGETATATLITCDPPGTSLHRLVVVGRQISPDPTGNVQATTVSTASTTATALPGNGPTLLGRFGRSVIGKLIIAVVIIAVFAYIIRRFKPAHHGGR
jgi:LPXTG-site transpeptidase (sortase) family protein